MSFLQLVLEEEIEIENTETMQTALRDRDAAQITI